MIFNLKSLGLALVAAFAISGLTASGASAQEQGELTSSGPVTLTQQTGGVAEGGPVTLTGTPEGEGSNAITAFGAEFTCSSATYKGHKYNATPHTYISTGATQITVTPTYGSCVLFGKAATADMNGCDYVFDLEKTIGTDEFGLKTTIVCPKEKHVVITVFDNETKHSEGKPYCTWTITEAAEGYGGLTATDTTSGSVKVSGTIEGLVIHEKSEGLCATTETKSGKLDLEVTLTGRNSSEESTPISISDEGKFEWDEGSPPPPVGFLAKTTTPIGTMECSETLYTGYGYNVTPHELLASGATTVTVIPHYHPCVVHIPIIGTRPVTIVMNGCDYVFHIGTTTGGVEGTYGLTTDIVCPEGKSIETNVYKAGMSHTVENLTCSYKIKSQAGLSGLHITSAGGSGHIDIGGSLESIHEEHSGTLCGTGTSTSSKFHVEITVLGLNQSGEETAISLSE